MPAYETSTARPPAPPKPPPSPKPPSSWLPGTQLQMPSATQSATSPALQAFSHGSPVGHSSVEQPSSPIIKPAHSSRPRVMAFPPESE